MDDRFRAFVATTKAAAEQLTAREHLAGDVKSVLFDLIQICEASESAQSEVAGQSSDLRLQKKRNEQSKAETKIAEKRVESVKAFAADLIESAKAINHESSSLTDIEAAGRIRLSLQKIAEVIREISKV